MTLLQIRIRCETGGKRIKEMQLVINTYGSYLRKKGNCFLVRKEDKVFEVSVTKVDSILITTAAYISTDAIKFAEFKDRVYRTHRYQSALYGLMIADNYGVEVKKGFVCYTRSNHLVKEVPLREKEFERAITLVN